MKAEPKTVVLVVNIWKRTGGLEAVNQDIARAFQSLGWRVKVVSVFGTDDDSDSCGCEVMSLCPRGKYPQYLWRRFFWKRIVGRHVRRSLIKGGLLIFGHSHLLPLLENLPLNATYKQWAWIYGIDVWGSQAVRWVPFLNRLDHVISISSFTAEEVCTAGLNCPISIVPCCVDTTVFKPTATPELIRRDEILICGRMAASERHKGHEVLFQSLPIAERLLGRSLSIRVIGTGDDQKRLAEVSRGLGINGRVKFFGWASMADLIEAYQHCGVFCMPSYLDRSDNEYWMGEGFGIVYIEAASCGRPVIASMEGGAPETIIPNQTGLLVEPRSPDSVAGAIADILSDSGRADEMGRQGRLMAETLFSREAFIRHVAALASADGF